jgi:hypothetical protein
MSPKPVEADFGIEIDFEAGSPAPSRVFRAMSALIDSFEKIDRDLVKSVARIEPVLLLENIEAGSIKAWLRTKLVAIDDEPIKSGDWKKVVGSFLVHCKYTIIDFIDHRTTITNKAELESLQTALLDAAKKTNVLAIPSYRPIPLENVAEYIKSITDPFHRCIREIRLDS